MENMTKASGLVRITELAKQLRCGLYVDYGTDLESAFNAANILAGSSREPAAVFTALYGVINTLCNVIEEECKDRKPAAYNYEGVLLFPDELTDWMRDGATALYEGKPNNVREGE